MDLIEQRYATHPGDIPRMDTAELREKIGRAHV